MATNVQDLEGDSFTITNHNADLALDCDSTTTGELADVIGSIIDNLIKQGILKGSVAGA